MDIPVVQPISACLDPATAQLEATHPPMPRSPGRPVEVDKEAVSAFVAQPLKQKQVALKEDWAELAYILVNRAKRIGATISRQDFGRLQQLVTSAGIAIDKVVPKGDPPPPPPPPVEGVNVYGNVMFNLFGSLGQAKVMDMLVPKLPQPKQEVIDVGIRQAGQTGGEVHVETE